MYARRTGNPSLAQASGPAKVPDSVRVRHSREIRRTVLCTQRQASPDAGSSDVEEKRLRNEVVGQFLEGGNVYVGVFDRVGNGKGPLFFHGRAS